MLTRHNFFGEQPSADKKGTFLKSIRSVLRPIEHGPSAGGELTIMSITIYYSKHKKAVYSILVAMRIVLTK